MDFDLSDDQRQIKDSVDRFLADTYADMKQRKAMQDGPGGYSKAVWAKYAELGLTAIPFSADDGGLGAGGIETMLVMESIGRNLAVDPYLSTIVLGGGVMRHAASAAQKAAILPDVIGGTRTLALAHQERQSRYDLADVSTKARAEIGRAHV